MKAFQLKFKSYFIQYLFSAWMIVGLLSCSSPPVIEESRIAPTGGGAISGGSIGNMYERSQFASLPGWGKDNFLEAWTAWQQSCKYFDRAKDPKWKSVCEQGKRVNSQDASSIQSYFEKYFDVWQIRNKQSGTSTGLITGYFEPLLEGSRKKTTKYQTPLYAYPKSWQSSPTKVRAPRGELLASGELSGNEIAWVEDPVAAAFMQIQGSGKILLNDGNVLRLGFAGTNNQTFQSFGKWLINHHELTAAQASMQGISNWAKMHPGRVDEMLNANPRLVFFKILPSSPDIHLGPIGSIGEALVAKRSIAVDWQYHPKGAPIFLATQDPQTSAPLNQLMFAQDTGSAILGEVRADFYWGSGEEAGLKAGKMKQQGRMWILLPK